MRPWGSKRTLPPGPPFGVLQALGYFHHPHAMLRDCARRYGPVFTVRTARLCVMTGHPDLVRRITSAPADQFGVNLERGPARLLGDKAMFKLAGRELRRERRLVVPQFGGESLASVGGEMKAATLDTLAALVPGQTFRMRDAALAIALDIILRSVLGGDTPERRQAYRTAVRAFTDGFVSPAFVGLNALGIESEFWGVNRRFNAAKATLEALLQDAIERARADGATSHGILGRMVAARYDDGQGMSDEALRANLVSLLVAGHETSVVALSWAVYWLHRRPECLERVLAELAPLGPDPDPAACQPLPYLDALVKEVLRLYPVVTDINRVLAKPLELGGYELPARTSVAAAAAILHYDPDLYPEPETFRPERFLERRFAPHEYIPFGGGERLCPGAVFSIFELKTVLATLLTRARFTLLDEGEPKLRRKGGPLPSPRTGVLLRHEGPRAV